FHVTGVQTCALPIFPPRNLRTRAGKRTTSTRAGPRVDRGRQEAGLFDLVAHPVGREHEPGVGVLHRGTEHDTDDTAVRVDQGTTRVTAAHLPPNGVDVALHGSRVVDVRSA